MSQLNSTPRVQYSCLFEFRELVDMGIGLAKPKQILVFGSVWTQTEYSARKPKMGALRRSRAEHSFLRRQPQIFFWEIQHTVMYGTKDRKSVFISTSEQYIGTKGWCASDVTKCL
jgi:hypothetical protein